jgi:hypothetical protein
MESYEGHSEDSFTLTGYSKDKIYTRASNQYGTGTTVQHTTINKSVMAAVHKIVQLEGTPYRSPADFFRDAVVHRLWHWQEKSDEDLIDPTALRLAEAEAETALVEQLNSLVSQRQSQVSKSNGEYRRLIQEEVQLDIAAIPDRFAFIKEDLRKLLG